MCDMGKPGFSQEDEQGDPRKFESTYPGCWPVGPMLLVNIRLNSWGSETSLSVSGLVIECLRHSSPRSGPV